MQYRMPGRTGIKVSPCAPGATPTRAIGSSTTPAAEIVEAHWVADRRGLRRSRAEQPPYSILDRGSERDVPPVCEQYGPGIRTSPLAVAPFAITHPGVTSVIIGPRTTAHLQDLLEGIGTTLDDGVPDRIDAIVAPGTGAGTLDTAYTPSLTETTRRRRPTATRNAA
ncbi:hypothetical protein [Streptomyces sp. NPDC005780]|uniref:hypothetical protein n=1 Tax=Streptomyces sp. NPDC005780 TaxID=3364730 RepID=UPI0036A4B8DC